MRTVILAYSLTMLAAAGCSDDPLRYSEPVSINLKAKSADTVQGVVSDDKGITTESSNPYGKFVTDARAQLGGHDPGSITLDGTSLLLGAGSTGVTRLGEIFTGDVEVLFEMNDTNNSFPAAAGTIAATDGGGPITLDSTFASSQVGSEDYTKLIAGSFKVSMRGPAAADFMTKGADADIQITLTFAAFE
jgi:hypothetical protein